MKTLVYAMAALVLAMALSLSPFLFDSENVEPEQPSVTSLTREPAAHPVEGTPEPEPVQEHAGQEVKEKEKEHNLILAGQEVTGQEYMLEHAELAQQTNGCFDVMMGMGCRIQSQVPIWNQFAAVFASHFGITCPVGTDILQL